eukprot:m.146674 g.146674  ORF g.146674 m.146674 type:complete len:98 (-) comp30489_c0_seq4:83-376(-)
MYQKVYKETFRRKAHDDLVHVLKTMLAPGGHAVIIAPTRSGTLERFCQKAQDALVITREATVDTTIEQAHVKVLADSVTTKYDENLHRPILLNVCVR